MGICSSSTSTVVSTAKVILHDGTLQEFSHPIKASQVLQKYPSTFICNSDEMEFDDVVSALRDEELLQPGQLYFALPLNKLRRRLLPEEMAALAVKASAALARSGGVKCGKKNVYFSTPTCSTGCGGLKGSGRVSDVGSVGVKARRGNFRAILSVIPEEK